MQWLRPGVETIHQAIHRREPDAFTVAVNEMCDVGAASRSGRLQLGFEVGGRVGGSRREPEPGPRPLGAPHDQDAEDEDPRRHDAVAVPVVGRRP